MDIHNKVNGNRNQFTKIISISIIIGLLLSSLLSFPLKIIALNTSKGEHLFIEHCSGCHIKGGNVIRRNKTLKLKDLKRNGIDNPNTIAVIARDGIGIMDGYDEILEEKDADLIANWIWEQSQNAWTQG